MSINLSNPNNEVQVREEYGIAKTGGHFAAECLDFSIPASDPVGDWTVHDASFPIPISLFSAQFIGGEESGGDELEFQISPDTTVGAIGADVDVDDDVITVSDTAYAALQIGYWMTLADGINTDDLGRVLEKQASNQIKVETAAVHSFAAATPTLVKLTVKMVPYGHLPEASRLVIGESKIGGTYLAANTTMRIRYCNKGGQEKTFEFWLEYLY